MTLHGYVEPVLGSSAAGDRFQFMREGYFCTDQESTLESPIFNRTVGLKDSYKA